MPRIMTENPISISTLNDFIFCPISIYFHQLYGTIDDIQMQSTYQINGSATHESIDNQRYSSSNDVLQGVSVISEEYGLIGRIDLFYVDKGLLVERKRQIKTIFDGYIFQLYAQYFGLTEMGYRVTRLQLYSSVDNKKYDVPLPKDNEEMFLKFNKVIDDMHNFDMGTFYQENRRKCCNCIYEPACDRSLKE